MTIEELHRKLSLLAFSAMGDETLAVHKARDAKSIINRPKLLKPNGARKITYIQISLFD